jgi:hypothetical protein
MLQTALMVYWLPSLESLDRVAAIETFTKRTFPELISIKQLAYIRLAFAAIIWLTSREFYFGPGVPLQTSYMPGTKLKTAIIPLKAWRTLCTFTSVAWLILGMSFTLSGFIALNAEEAPQRISAPLLRAAIIFWTASAPYTLLVAGIIRYVIWPQVLRDGGTTEDLRCLRNRLMHNFNVLMAVSELALLGGIGIRLEDMVFGTLLGCLYTLFMWCMTNSWGVKKDDGPQYIYFFCDTTLPGLRPTQSLIGLMGVLSIFMVLFASAEKILGLLPGGLNTHLLFVIIVCGSVMRFRD